MVANGRSQKGRNVKMVDEYDTLIYISNFNFSFLSKQTVNGYIQHTLFFSLNYAS